MHYWYLAFIVLSIISLLLDLQMKPGTEDPKPPSTTTATVS